MDNLHIEGLTVNTQIGVHAWEQQITQPLLIDISLPIEVSDCADDLAKTIDYDKLCRLVSTYVESRSFRLIETVANQVADLIKQEFAINQLSVTVSKPQAIKNAANVKITVLR